LCGGTGLYFRALLEGLGEAPPADKTLRAELEAMPLADLLRELAERDAVTYERIDRQNSRRVIRAMEVIRLTGKPFSEQRADWGSKSAQPIQHAEMRPGVADSIPPHLGPLARSAGEGEPSLPIEYQNSPFFVALSRAMPDLRRRIDIRVEEMFRRGLVAETEGLLKRGLAENQTAMQALGYRQVIEHLRGDRSLPETIELVKIRTRQFAKRQTTWFKKQPCVQWVQIAPEEDCEIVVEKVMRSQGAWKAEKTALVLKKP
jgi:tRNA dimethylallyltransferase